MTDRYQIISPIGTCGTGTIHRGWDGSQNRGVLVTRYPVQGEALQEFSQNARKLYTLRHPNLVVVYDSGTDDQGGYLVTEMIKGEPLERRVSQGTMKEADFVQFTRLMLEGLSAAHGNGLLHLNLHPENITLPWNVNKTVQVKIINFNLVPSVRNQDSPHFMAPEQFGQAHVDQRTDLYALGTVLYYVLTQQHAFEGADASQVIVSHLYHRITPLTSVRPDLPHSICGWVERLMSQDVKDRPASSSEALRIFNAIVQQESAVSAPILMVDDDIPVLLQKHVEEEEAVAAAFVEEEETVAAVISEEEAIAAALSEEEPEEHFAALEAEEEPTSVSPANDEVPVQPSLTTAPEVESEPLRPAFADEPEIEPDHAAAAAPVPEHEPKPVLATNPAPAPPPLVVAPVSVPVTAPTHSPVASSAAAELDPQEGITSEVEEEEAAAAAAAAEHQAQIERPLDHLVRSTPAYTATPPAPPRKARMSTMALIIGAFIFMVLAMLGFTSYVQYSQRGEREQRFSEMTKSALPLGSDLDVRILFDYLNDSTTRDAAAAVLAKLQGGDYIDPMITTQLGEIKQTTTISKIVEVIGKRHAYSAFPAVLPLVHDRNEGVRKAAWLTLGKITQPKDLPALIESVRHTSRGDQDDIVIAVSSAAENAKEKDQAVQIIQKAYQDPKGDDGSRAVLLEVLVHVGGSGTLDIINAAIADPAIPVRLAAIKLLIEYPSHDPLPAITARFKEESDAACRLYLIAAAKEIADKPGPITQEALALHIQSLYSNAKTEDEKMQALSAVGNVTAEATTTFYQELAKSTDDTSMRRAARQAAQLFAERLENTVAIAPAKTSTYLPASKAESSLENSDDDVLSGWASESDSASWIIQIPTNGDYEITIQQAHGTDLLGTYEILLAGQTLLTSVVKTKNDKDFQSFIVGKISVAQPGTYTILLRPRTLPPEGDLFRVKSLGVKFPGA